MQLIFDERAKNKGICARPKGYSRFYADSEELFKNETNRREEMTPYEILKEEADKNLIDISVIFPVLGLIRKAMRTYGMQEYIKGVEDGKKEAMK